MKCQCMTAAGIQCTRNATNGNFCFQHRNCKNPVVKSKEKTKSPQNKASSPEKKQPSKLQTEGYIGLLPKDVKGIVQGYKDSANYTFIHWLLSSETFIEDILNAPERRFPRAQRLLNEVFKKHKLGVEITNQRKSKKTYGSPESLRSYTARQASVEGTLGPVSDEAMVDILRLFYWSEGILGHFNNELSKVGNQFRYVIGKKEHTEGINSTIVEIVKIQGSPVILTKRTVM